MCIRDSTSTDGQHELGMEVYGLEAGSYQVNAGSYTGSFSVTDAESSKIVVPIGKDSTLITVTKTAEAGKLDVQIEAQDTAVVSDTVKLYGNAVIGNAQLVTADAYEW